MNDKSKHWLSLSEYDIETAHAMLETKRYLYVGFMCHQTIEKALKAVIASSNVMPPRIHGLKVLAEQSNIYKDMDDDQKNFLDILSPLNVATRYSDDKAKLTSVLTPVKCKDILDETEELLCWIKQQLSKLQSVTHNG